MSALAVYEEEEVVRVAPTMMVTYAEIRTWAVWLHTLTASDLADAMGVSYEIGVRGVRALVWHGIMEGTGAFLDGPHGPEEIHSYVPLPQDAPRNRPRGPLPERTAVAQFGPLIYDQRGMPVRIRTERDMRKILSTAGARSHHKAREAAYHKQEQARMDALEKQHRRSQAEKQKNSEWIRKAKARLSRGLY